MTAIRTLKEEVQVSRQSVTCPRIPLHTVVANIKNPASYPTGVDVDDGS